MILRKELLLNIKKFQKKNNKEILDIIIFGSATRGKRKPADIDILLIFKDQENSELTYQLTEVFERYNLKSEITAIIYQEMFDIDFLPRESILSEGHSLITNQSLSESFGFKTYTMFIYTQKGFSQTKRMKFHYALNGRNKNQGVLKQISGIKLTDGSAIAPLEKSEEFKNFLELWEVSYRHFNILISKRTIEYKEFGL